MDYPSFKVLAQVRPHQALYGGRPMVEFSWRVSDGFSETSFNHLLDARDINLAGVLPYLLSMANHRLTEFFAKEGESLVEKLEGINKAKQAVEAQRLKRLMFPPTDELPDVEYD